jgi:hypothetical protein
VYTLCPGKSSKASKKNRKIFIMDRGGNFSRMRPGESVLFSSRLARGTRGRGSAETREGRQLKSLTRLNRAAPACYLKRPFAKPAVLFYFHASVFANKIRWFTYV